MARHKDFGDLGGDLQPFAGQGLQGLISHPEQAEIVVGTASTLSTDETLELERCEGIIEKGLKTFLEVGTALAQVRDLRLYRVAYATFEAYCAERWSLKRQRAYELMNAASVVRQLSEISDIPPPERESHAAALARLKDPEQQRQAWKQALDNADGQVTAGHVTAAVREVQGQNAPPSRGAAEVIEGEVVGDTPGAAVGSAPVEGEPAAPQQYVDDLSPREAAALRERNAELEQRLAAAQSIIEEYQEHITRAQHYKPTSDRGEAVSPLLRALERVTLLLRGENQ